LITRHEHAAQLDWLCQRGRVELIPAGPVYAEGDQASRFYVLLDGTIVLSRRIGADDIEVGRSASRRPSAPGCWSGRCRGCTAASKPNC
jgi:hypothetical protein